MTLREFCKLDGMQETLWKWSNVPMPTTPFDNKSLVRRVKKPFVSLPLAAFEIERRRSQWVLYLCHMTTVLIIRFQNAIEIHMDFDL